MGLIEFDVDLWRVRLGLPPGLCHAFQVVFYDLEACGLSHVGTSISICSNTADPGVQQFSLHLATIFG